MGPPWGIDPTTDIPMSRCSTMDVTSCSVAHWCRPTSDSVSVSYSTKQNCPSYLYLINFCSFASNRFIRMSASSPILHTKLRSMTKRLNVWGKDKATGFILRFYRCLLKKRKEKNPYYQMLNILISITQISIYYTNLKHFRITCLIILHCTNLKAII